MLTHGHKHAPESAAGKHSQLKYNLSGLHRDWRTWLIIGLMLAAIGTYVMTLDESIQPNGAAPGGLQAGAAPANTPK